ncbi:MAG: hypothetical protein GEU93_03095 [Propionibacteriales bacterium]|nr:hypothetical protein [Propionibacteriales bacterium]
MSARWWLLVGATASGWVALALAAIGGAGESWWAVAAGAVSLGAWNRRLSWLSVAVPVGVVLLLLYSGSVVAGAACGLLVLFHVVLVDLAEDSYGASADGAVRALRPLVPGLAAAVVAAVAGGLSVVWARGVDAVTPVVVAAPLVLLVAAMVALGSETRREFWLWLSRR